MKNCADDPAAALKIAAVVTAAGAGSDGRMTRKNTAFGYHYELPTVKMKITGNRDAGSRHSAVTTERDSGTGRGDTRAIPTA